MDKLFKAAFMLAVMSLAGNLAYAAGGKVTSGAVLPDGSACMCASFPLPKDHWIYAPSGEPPMPLRRGAFAS